MHPIANIDTAHRVREHLTALLGPEPVTTQVLHLVAVWSSPAGEARVMRINEQTPRSANDFFLLNAGRARAQAIVTTGKILREEPELSYELRGQGRVGQGLADYRCAELGEGAPPHVLILTSGRGLDLSRPVFDDDARPLIYTSPDGAGRIAREAADRGVEVVGEPDPDVRSAIRYLEERGLGRITVEAGPSTFRELYQPPEVIEELWVSTYLSESLPEEVVGDAFPELDGGLAAYTAGRRRTVEEGSGPWSFTPWRKHHQS